MKVLPVLDLLNGQIVRGVAGRRQEYRPIVSRLCNSAEPTAVAQAFRENFGLTELYVADLDAIEQQKPAWRIYEALQALGFQLWLDAGVRTVEDVAPLAIAGIQTIVLGLETIRGPEILRELCQAYDSARFVFSLDLRGGQPLADATLWHTSDAWSIATTALACGIRRVIVLDLAHVGVGQGPGTDDLCQRLLTLVPQLEVVTGGGVRDGHDLRHLKALGVHGVLIASALHDGRLSRNELSEFGSQDSAG